ncbi:MAG TPA: hypothetical protein GX523_20350 [Desulfitobacterium dehalogenans]|uniref:Uncharacterized protein n=1 Tax=Desulfitobacterium dehalogenans TaxID=36854 RepID=A0A7C7D8R7_9FIRM|nr:hypothetical protein [Desulfitobacterium dehalogenans]
MMYQTQKKRILAYLKSYIKLIRKKRGQDLNSFFVSLCNVDREIFNILKQDSHLLGEDITIIYMNQDDYYSVVQMRNNTEISQILVLTAKSIKHIDSLKHYSEFEILPPTSISAGKEDLAFVCFDEILTDMLSADIALKQKHVIRHFDLILKDRQPSLVQILSYIDSSYLPEKNEFSEELLNRNLTELGCWYSKEKKLVSLYEMKRIIRSSDNQTIIGKLENARSPEIRNLIFQNKFDDLIRTEPFENIREYFVGTRSPKRNRDDSIHNENSEQWLYSYDGFLEENDGSGLIKQYERESAYYLTSEDNNTDSSIDERKASAEDNPNLERSRKAFDSFLDHFNLFPPALKYVDDLCNEILLQCNTQGTARTKIEGLLENLKESYSTFSRYIRNLLEDMPFPFPLASVVEAGRAFACSYIDLIIFIFENDYLLNQLNAYGHIEKLQNLFVRCDGQKAFLPFYHPICLLYFMKVDQVYKLFLELTGETGNVKQTLLAEVLEGYKAGFPIQNLYCNRQFYRLDKRFLDCPYFIEFSISGQTSSLNIISVSIVLNKIRDYIERHPYISQLKVMLVGDLDLGNVRRLVNQIKQFCSQEATLMNRLVLTIAPGDVREMRKQLEESFANEAIPDNIKFRLLQEGVELWDGNSINEIVESQDLVFFLDSPVLYKALFFEPIQVSAEYTKQCILESNADRMVAEMIEGELEEHLPILWEGLQYSDQNPKVKMGQWRLRQVDTVFLDSLLRTIEKKPGLEFFVFSPDHSIRDAVRFNKRVRVATEKNKGEEVISVRFSVHDEKQNSEQLEPQGVPQPQCIIHLEADWIKAMLDSDDSTSASQIDISISIVNNTLHIDMLCDSAMEEDSEEMRSIVEEFLRGIFPKEGNLFTVKLKKSYRRQSFFYCRSYVDAFLCDYVYNTLEFDVDEAIVINERPNNGICRNDFNHFNYFQAEDFIAFLNRNKKFSEGTVSDFLRDFFGGDMLAQIKGEVEQLENVYAPYKEKLELLQKEICRYEGK